MKKTSTALLALAVACAAACAPKVNDPADVQAVKDKAPAYDKFANAGDAASLAAVFYAPDGIRMDPNLPASAGTAAIRATLEKSYAQSTENVRNVIDDVRVAGSFAVAKGTFEGTSTPKAGGSGKETLIDPWQQLALRGTGQTTRPARRRPGPHPGPGSRVLRRR